MALSSLSSGMQPLTCQRSQFGKLSLELYTDGSGVEHSYIEFNPKVRPQEYYLSHQLNSYTHYGPASAIYNLHVKYRDKDLAWQPVTQAFKYDLRKLMDSAEQGLDVPLDEYSQNELGHFNDLLNRADSFIRKNKQGDFILTIPHSNEAIRRIEGAGPQSSLLTPAETLPTGSALSLPEAQDKPPQKSSETDDSLVTGDTSNPGLTPTPLPTTPTATMPAMGTNIAPMQTFPPNATAPARPAFALWA